MAEAVVDDDDDAGVGRALRLALLRLPLLPALPLRCRVEPVGDRSSSSRVRSSAGGTTSPLLIPSMPKSIPDTEREGEREGWGEREGGMG